MKHQVYKFLPLLAIYLILVLVFSPDTPWGDENGYIRYAARIIQMHEYPQVNEAAMWWGPGYPIVLSPFLLFNLPWLTARLLNAFFLFGAIIYFYRTLSLYLENKQATAIAVLLGIYPPLMKEVHRLMTESFVIFLVCGFMYHFCRLHRENGSSRFHAASAFFFLGYLALTKIIFGYTILAGLVLSLALFMWRRNERLKKTAAAYFFSLILCIPYLLYTYSQTGRVFYWGSSGGLSLYWMSVSYNENELGSWFSFKDVRELPELAPHQEFFNEIASLSETERDDALKKRAIENIIRHPVTFLVNWTANIGRLLFSYPFSYTNQKLSTYFYILPNIFIVVSFVFGIYPAMMRRRMIPDEISALLLFTLIAFGTSSLVSAFERQFRPLVPFLLLWLSFVYIRILRIEVRHDAEIV